MISYFLKFPTQNALIVTSLYICPGHIVRLSFGCPNDTFFSENASYLLTSSILFSYLPPFNHFSSVRTRVTGFFLKPPINAQLPHVRLKRDRIWKQGLVTFGRSVRWFEPLRPLPLVCGPWPSPLDTETRRRTHVLNVNNIWQPAIRVYSMKTHGHHGPSGRRVRERVTAVPLINSGGATRWPAARDTTSDTKYAICRYVTNGCAKNCVFSRQKISLFRVQACDSRMLHGYKFSTYNPHRHGVCAPNVLCLLGVIIEQKRCPLHSPVKINRTM